MSHAKVGLLVFEYAYQINRISVKRCNSVLRMITKDNRALQHVDIDMTLFDTLHALLNM